MYFKKLELVGFKSFPEKTTLHFEPGITAIVGPNGCGKSNIFDSIRWVLGEQSAKSLRGSEMQDVIFNGTDVKEPFGMAEVTLTFDNQKRFFNFEHDEVTITRRIFRSSESEYLLNKSPVRLKDILDLLMGTGIGAESYSLVAQGKIDLVLSSRPEDRRLVFDEASGITKYKVQKRESLRKLEETEQNLLRVNDIITEVKRQIGSLERQANKARKYKETFEELKSRELNLAILQKNELFKERDEVIKQLSALEAKESSLLSLIQNEDAKIIHHQAELKDLENSIMEVRNKLLSLENLVIRDEEHANFDREKIIELNTTKKYLENQIAQVKIKLTQDEEKLNNVRQESDDAKKNIEIKSQLLKELDTQINDLTTSVKNSLEVIAKSKKDILDLATKIAGVRNQISEFSAHQQIYLARKKRLQVEKAKIFQEKAVSEESLNDITQEVASLKEVIGEINLKISGLNEDLEREQVTLNNLDLNISALEKEGLALQSHKEFLEKLKTKYEDTSDLMNALIYLDKSPSENVSGLVVKVKECLNLNDEDKLYFEHATLKLSGEAKPIEMDVQKIVEKLNKLQEDLSILRNEKGLKEGCIARLNNSKIALGEDLRNQEIALANKQTSQLGILEQFNKIREEEDIVVLEMQDVQKEISVLETNLTQCQSHLSELNNEQRRLEDLILQQEDKISLNSKSREGVLVMITQTKTELDALSRQLNSEEATLKILEDTFKQDQENLLNLQRQIGDTEIKIDSLELEIKDFEKRVSEAKIDIENQNNLLKEMENKHKGLSEGTSDVVKRIESERVELDNIRNQLYQLQMQNKDIDYSYTSIKDRILAAYKIDLETVQLVSEQIEKEPLIEEIKNLKDKLDSYGTVNLVAIEEYDELKKRYDFLIQQQSDLLSAKDALHQAILKINRITKQMFLETFEKVRLEFRNYFKLLFNGGDAQIYLVDEQDPLESGIEIICRPPGKKLQNVLLLSGGEKALSAIALIFAIFKVKPSPFCVLDEIDAALDEANVDRFSRVLQDFAKDSQFIVITHNKKTITNASVMYGITMEESGISKIVSVKFAKDAPGKDKEPDAFVSEAV